MSLEENKTIVRRLIEEGTNKNDPVVIDEILAPEFEMMGPGHDRERFKQASNLVNTIFGNRKDTIDEMIAENDGVMVRLTRSGVHKGDLPSAIVGSIAPTGKNVSFSVLFIYRVLNGKIVSGRSFTDQATLLQQLGALPTQK